MLVMRTETGIHSATEKSRLEEKRVSDLPLSKQRMTAISAAYRPSITHERSPLRSGARLLGALFGTSEESPLLSESRHIYLHVTRSDP